jgi:hypothetical protein
VGKNQRKVNNDQSSGAGWSIGFLADMQEMGSTEFVDSLGKKCRCNQV